MAAVLKIGVLGMLGVLWAIQLKSQRPEYGMLMGIGICISIFGYTVGQFRTVFEEFDLLKGYLGGGEGYLTVLVKTLGIAYICEFSAAICRDSGYGAVAQQIEILGKLTVIGAGLPILFDVIRQIQNFA